MAPRHEHSERRFDAVQAEIDGERAAALGRAGRRVEGAFARCRDLLAALDADRTTADTPADRPAAPTDAGAELVEDYRAARAEFDQAMYAYLVQREAIGMLDHRAVRQALPRPPRR